MRKSQFSENQIYWILLQANGKQNISDICRQHGISVSTYYRWKSKYNTKIVPERNKLKKLEAENSELKLMFANLFLENKNLKQSIFNNSIP
jgi:putative transposase